MVSIPRISIPKLSKIKRDIAASKQYYSQSVKNGWHEGKQIAAKNHYGKTRTLYTQTKKSITNTANINDLPKLLTVVGACTPLPGGFALGYVFGKAIQLVVKGIKKVK